MIKKTVKKSEVEKSEATNEVQEAAMCAEEAAMCAEGGGKGWEQTKVEVACSGPAVENGINASVAACVGRVGKPQAKRGKRFHGERLKLLVEVCEKWCLFGQPWNTLFVRDAHALIDLGLLEYVKSDNGYMQVKPTETGIDRYKTIVAGVFGVEVEAA